MKNILFKLKSYFLKKGIFEQMFTFRYIVYINDLPYFLISKNSLIAKRNYIKFKAWEPIDSKSIKFMSDAVFDKVEKIDNMKLCKIGPAGDIIEENSYSGVELKKVYILCDEFDETADADICTVAMRVIQLKLKFKSVKKIIN